MSVRFSHQISNVHTQKYSSAQTSLECLWGLTSPPNSNSSVFWRYTSISSRKSIHRVVCRHYHTNSRYAQISTLYIRCRQELGSSCSERWVQVTCLVTTKKETVSTCQRSNDGDINMMGAVSCRADDNDNDWEFIYLIGIPSIVPMFCLSLWLSESTELWRICDATVSR